MCTIAHYSKTTTRTTAYTGEGSSTQEASDNSFVPAKGKEKGVSVAIKANALAKGLHDRKEEVVKKGTSPFVSPSVRHHRMLVVQVTNFLCRRQPADTVEAQKQPRQGYLWRGDSRHESRYEEADGGQGGQLRKRARHQQEGQSNTHSVYTPELRPNQRSVLWLDQMDLVANEIESLRALRHPHIVDYLGTEKEDNTLRIFLEYAPHPLLLLHFVGSA